MKPSIWIQRNRRKSSQQRFEYSLNIAKNSADSIIQTQPFLTGFLLQINSLTPTVVQLEACKKWNSWHTVKYTKIVYFYILISCITEEKHPNDKAELLGFCCVPETAWLNKIYRFGHACVRQAPLTRRNFFSKLSHHYGGWFSSKDSLRIQVSKTRRGQRVTSPLTALMPQNNSHHA